MSIRSVLSRLRACFHRCDHGFAAVAGDKPIGVRDYAVGEFGGEHEILAPSLQQRAQKLLRLPELVDVRRVEEVATGVAIRLEDRLACLRIGTMAPAGSEIAGAERKLRDPNAGLPKRCGSHVLLLSLHRDDVGSASGSAYRGARLSPRMTITGTARECSMANSAVISGRETPMPSSRRPRDTERMPPCPAPHKGRARHSAGCGPDRWSCC